MNPDRKKPVFPDNPKRGDKFDYEVSIYTTRKKCPTYLRYEFDGERWNGVSYVDEDGRAIDDF